MPGSTKTYCFRNAALVGKCRPTEREAIEDAIHAGQAHRRGRQLVWRTPTEIVVCESPPPLPTKARLASDAAISLSLAPVASSPGVKPSPEFTEATSIAANRPKISSRRTGKR
ncbi:MAG TPA: hypothetical protein VFO69_14275 [Allosphingosinicella sp.]|nr:hypothetical protein [Allosphingosinicella sp.]